MDLESVKVKVRKFLRKEFPEIAIDSDEMGITDEISHVIFELIEGDDGDDEGTLDHFNRYIAGDR